MIHSLTRSLVGPLALGAAFCAAPLAARPPENAVVEREGVDTLQVAWTSDAPVDVYIADQPGASLASARLALSRDADGHAAIEHATAPHPYVILRNSRTGEIARVAERVIPLEAGSNFRDIGGYPTAGGRRVRWGLIYRSGATPLIDAADKRRIAGLGLANLIDLRSDEERQLAPTRIDGVPYTAVGYSMGEIMSGSGSINSMEAVYRGLPTLVAPQLRQMFAKLLRREGPLAFNCSAGQDRTGFAAAVVLSALGVDYPTIVQDYHLSTLYRRPEFEMPPIDPAKFPGNPAAAMFGHLQNDPRARQPQPLKTGEGKPYLDFAFAEVQHRWGGIEGYLRQELGLTDQDLGQLRSAYTE